MDSCAEQSKEPGKAQKISEEVEEEEFVLLDLDDVFTGADINANVPYHLSIGEYQETIGTCYVFSEKGDASRKLPSENLCYEVLESKDTMDTNGGPSKDNTPITSLHKVLKFRFLTEE